MEQPQTIKSLSLNDIETRLSEGAVFSATFEGFTFRAREVEPGAYALIGTREGAGSPEIVDGAAGALKLLNLLEQWSSQMQASLDSWSLTTP